ncbi:MAG: trypsin-like peptidase domain-containing protein [Patescibacteria group bacterium]
MAEKQSISAIKKALPAVVSISISKQLPAKENPFGTATFGASKSALSLKKNKKIKIGGGSGFIIDGSGIILTNRHVVEDLKAEYAVALNDGTKHPAQVLARDPINDIAILKIVAENLPVIEMADSSKLDLGQTAIAIGNVLGIFKNTVSIGVVSGLSRNIQAGSSLTGEITMLRGLIQTDAAINPGNSGGPLIDSSGRVIGINAATIMAAENIGFALPINVAKRNLEEVKQYGRIRQPFLGVRYVSVNKALQKQFALPTDKGAWLISEPDPDGRNGQAVTLGSPAHKAGLREGDIVLTLASEEISEQNPLNVILDRFEANDKIEITALRDSKPISFKIILDEKL